MGGFWKKLFGTEQSPEAIAEARIQAALRSGALDLDLSKLELRQLPPSIGQLTQLWLLDVSGNQLAALPESLRQLTQLKGLKASDNQLTALPESLGQLTHIGYVVKDSRKSAPDRIAAARVVDPV